MNFLTKKTVKRLLGALASVLLVLPMAAQLPTSVDVDLAPGATATQLEVRVKANGNSFNEVVSGLTFTIRWVDSSPATLGIVNSTWCPPPTAAFNLNPSAMVTPGNGFKYRTYTTVGTEQIGLIQDDGGCGASGQTLPADTWVAVGTINVSNNTGCTEFQIVNDAYTGANNRNFFVSLNGVQGLAGTIEPTTVLRGNCTVDCNGVVGGTASIDQCNVCSGGNTGITPNSTCSDCAGVPNGTASIDQCNVCSGGTTGITPNSTCSDCAGVPNGTASIDQCNVCSGGTTGITPNSTCSDCAGVPNGTASIDQCNVCSGGTTGITPNSTCADCAGVPNGTASIDQCNVCSGGTTGITPNSTCLDCNGDINGTASIDQCNVCSGGNTGITPNSTCSDCAGVPNGTASIDQCNVCSGGTTGITPNSTCLDCNGDINGTAFLDNCNVCVGGNTGLTPCTNDCNGDPGGSASVDQCGVCSGGNTGITPNSTCLDCNGDINGTASIDQCNVCSGGNTGITPNSTCSDCAGVPNGTASIDQCNVCSGGTTGITPNSTCLDCNGDINGTAFLDNCNVCVGGNTGLTPCTNDCNGDPGGSASVDQCGVCSGGNTGITPNSTCLDCNGDINGTASIDQCNVCSGGNTGITPNSTCSDCAGVPNGTASIDQCNVCSGGTTGITPNSTCLDCNGDINGTASVDQCGVCSGGNTGVTPNSTCLDCNGDINGTASIDLCNVCSGGNTGITPNSTCLDCEGVPNGPAIVGTPCDDGNIATENDTWTAGCQCIGTPVGGCDYPVNLVLETDANGSETTWEIIIDGTETVACSGGNYTGANNTYIGEQCCLSAGCYLLRVYDSAGDGMGTGGYVLSTQNGNRIIDNADNGSFGSVSAIANGEGFCLPMGSDRWITTSCDKEFWLNNEYIVADGNPLVSAQYGVTNATSGYQAWWFDPNGGYSFKRFQSHSTSNGLAAGPTRACHFKINAWSGNQLQEGVLYNARVRGRVDGSYLEFGPACRFRLNGTLAQCPPTQLVNSTALPEFSCGVTRQFPSNDKIWAWSRPGANKYQFEFSLPAEGITFRRASTSNWIKLNWGGAYVLENGRTYDVRVRISKTNGATWCDWGATCQLTIDNGTSQIGIGGQRDLMLAAEAPAMTVYPNPNRGDQVMVNVSGLESLTATLDLYDLLGNKVRTMVLQVAEGRIAQPIELGGDLSDGVYVLSLSDGSTSFTQRLMIQR